ncbi:hypothetical protein CDLVIII_3909 [Clostridium sp. DL-VIII]|uniref:hypothetical protein n=1 Tax=Clostridium sp. DL-VIII TaxID=641107 RepID=UPI00023B0115|nr:hypothetical protein [Clostridium sp. DL-VIII]EHJ00452.1 hypothetical protein CDLVIII_3909 [Clostridium sp. DL-VIII]
MKRFILSFFIVLFLSFTIIGSTTTPNPLTSNVFKEGIYKLNTYESILKDKMYKAENVSTDKSSYLTIYDDNFMPLQSIRLQPQSIKYDLTPLKANYTMVIVGDGDIYFS